ncbi:MAG: 4Fe-4S dicluster domain-containing protein [Candidatus Hodgkinia cicadicola]
MTSKESKVTNSITFDVIVVGAGPSGLMVSIKLKQLDSKLSILVLEKASVIGGHSLSGAILEINEQNESFIKSLELATNVKSDHVWYLTQSKHIDLSSLIPANLSNINCMIIDLPELCTKMADRAKSLGIEIIECCGVNDVIKDGTLVVGVELTDGSRLFGKHVFLAEGANGTVTTKLLNFHNNKIARSFALGLKEEWELVTRNSVGNVYHTVGWPSTIHNSWGGGFIYFNKNVLSIGYVIHLDYKNAYIRPNDELNLLKAHPSIKGLLRGNIGKRIKYGAKLITLSSIGLSTDACYSGCTVIGCAFGLVNTLRLKGLDMALKSGCIAASNYISFLSKSNTMRTWLFPKLEANLAWSRKVTAVMKKCGIVIGMIVKVISKPFVTKWFAKASDNEMTFKASVCRPLRNWNQIDERIDSLNYSGNTYSNRSSHIMVYDKLAYKLYDLRTQDKLTSRLCPARVYEWLKINKHYSPIIRYENCLQCKACCAKPIAGMITWNPSENGGGPNYVSRNIIS